MWIGSFYFILFYFPLAYFASRYSYDSNNNLSRSTRRTDGGQSWKNVERIVPYLPPVQSTSTMVSKRYFLDLATNQYHTVHFLRTSTDNKH
jgi:hypothetical protein